MSQVRKHNPELAAKHEDYFRSEIVSHMKRAKPKEHHFRPWQEMLNDKLKEPFSDCEVIFVVDLVGCAGKSWFVEQRCFLDEKKCIGVGADKRQDVAYNITNQVIENGTPDVLFMDAPRARGAYVSYALLEELKDGKLSVSKYKSKTLPLEKRPHVVVMMNEFPKKDFNEKGLSSDRYTYLIISKDGQRGKWIQGYKDPHALETTLYEKIQETVQSRLPNRLQDKLNRAFAACFSTPEQTAKEDDIENALVSAIRSWIPAKSAASSA